MDRFLLPHLEEDWAERLGTKSPFPVACLSLCMRYNTLLCARTGWVWGKALLGPPCSTTLKWFNGHIVSIPRANSHPPLRRRKMDGWIGSATSTLLLCFKVGLCSLQFAQSAEFMPWALPTYSGTCMEENLHTWINAKVIYGHNAWRALRREAPPYSSLYSHIA